MLPKECVAYSGHVEDDGTRLNKTTIQNGYVVTSLSRIIKPVL